MKRKSISQLGCVPGFAKKLNPGTQEKAPEPAIVMFEVKIETPSFIICPSPTPSVELILEVKVSDRNPTSRTKACSTLPRDRSFSFWTELPNDARDLSVHRRFLGLFPKSECSPEKRDLFHNLGLTSPLSPPEKKRPYYVDRKHPCRCKESDWRSPGRKRHDLTCISSMDITHPSVFDFIRTISQDYFCDPLEAFRNTETKVSCDASCSTALRELVLYNKPQYPADWSAVFQKPPDKWSSRKAVLRAILSRKREKENQKLEKLKKFANEEPVAQPTLLSNNHACNNNAIEKLKQVFPKLGREVFVVIEEHVTSVLCALCNKELYLCMDQVHSACSHYPLPRVDFNLSNALRLACPQPIKKQRISCTNI